jgi:nucleotide-binding universal stress UspA family protein
MGIVRVIDSEICYGKAWVIPRAIFSSDTLNNKKGAPAMEKRILLVVDESIHSTNAITYAVRISSVVKNLSYTLFHVQPTLSQYLLDEAESDLKAKAALKAVIRKNSEFAKALLDKHKSRMVRMGISEKRIETLTQQKTMGTCKDILDYAQHGLYDAILVGRRGLSRFQQTFMGSTTAKLVEHSVMVPVWVVDGDVKSTRVMLAVDGSEASFRAVDHLSFMLEGNEEIKITLLHVTPTIRDYCEIDFSEKKSDVGGIIARGARRCVDSFFPHALEKFREAGLREDQVKIDLVKRTMDIGKAIVNKAKKEDYGTVVVGRRGTGKAFFMGSVSKYVLDKTSGRALWVVS